MPTWTVGCSTRVWLRHRWFIEYHWCAAELPIRLIRSAAPSLRQRWLLLLAFSRDGHLCIWARMRTCVFHVVRVSSGGLFEVIITFQRFAVIQDYAPIITSHCAGPAWMAPLGWSCVMWAVRIVGVGDIASGALRAIEPSDRTMKRTGSATHRKVSGDAA